MRAIRATMPESCASELLPEEMRHKGASMRETSLLAIAVLTSVGLLTTASAGTAAASGTEGSEGATTATASAAASCGVTWGSLPKTSTGRATGR